MLGDQINRAIDNAWAAVRREILADPQELHRRLARRRLKSLTRPARAWCIAIRASDRRITPMHWLITPEHALDLNHPEHPYEPIEHQVTIQKHAIRRYCNPVSFSREQSVEVAKMLGVSPATLWYARSRGVFHEDRIKLLGGKRGHPVPLLSPNGKIFDPGHANFHAPPHPAWGSSWEWLSHRFPDRFEQTVTRRPVFRKAKVRSKSARNASPPLYHDDLKLRGWRWICPGCKKPVRTIYFPLPVRNMFDRWFIDPAKRLKLGDFNLPQPPPPTFACHKCHDIQYFSSVWPSAWNHLVSYLSAGLLYGKEVPKPAGFLPERKKTRIRQLNRHAPQRRKVFTRLRNGWSNPQIARELGISVPAVNQHVYHICREENVKNRHELAQKHQFAKSPPLNRLETTAPRRILVRDMLIQNLSYRQMCQNLNVKRVVIHGDVRRIYRSYGIKLKGFAARRALAQKLGVPYLTKGDQIRNQITELRETGLTWKQIAKALHLTEPGVQWHVQQLRQQQKGLKSPQAVPSPSAS